MSQKFNFFMHQFDAAEAARVANPDNLKVIEPTESLARSAALFAAQMERKALESAKKETEVCA